MDPDSTYALMVDPTCDMDEQAVAAVDLLVWIAQGGPAPSQWRAPDEFYDPAARQADIEQCKHKIFRALDRLAELEAT